MRHQAPFHRSYTRVRTGSRLPSAYVPQVPGSLAEPWYLVCCAKSLWSRSGWVERELQSLHVRVAIRLTIVRKGCTGTAYRFHCICSTAPAVGHGIAWGDKDRSI